jgi:hypothetical protein
MEHAWPLGVAAKAMKLDRVGVPRSVARSITGHKTESMYLRYRAVRREEQDEGAREGARRRPSSTTGARQGRSRPFVCETSVAVTRRASRPGTRTASA